MWSLFSSNGDVNLLGSPTRKATGVVQVDLQRIWLLVVLLLTETTSVAPQKSASIAPSCIMRPLPALGRGDTLKQTLQQLNFLLNPDTKRNRLFTSLNNSGLETKHHVPQSLYTK